MGNRKVLSLDRNYCVEKDNSKYNFENVENTENIQRTCRQFEVRVVLEDCLKGKKDILTHDNKKIGDYTIDILDHTMSLPYCSTPKPRMGKYSYSCSLEDYRSKNCESKFIRNCESYSAYEDQKLQKEFHTSQQKKYPQHVSSVVRDKNAALTISPLSPILSGCQLTPRKSKERTPRLSFSRQHQETSPPRFPAGTSQGSRSKNRSHSSVLSPGGLRSPQMSPGGLRSPQLSPGGFCSSGLSSERVGSSTPLGSLAGSFERSYSRTPSRSSSVSSKYSHSPQAPLGRTRLSVEYPGRHPGSLLSTHQPSPTKTTPRRKPGPLSRTRQQLPARTPPRQSPVRTPRRRPGPLSRTHQELPARTPPSQSPFRTPRRRPGPRCYTQHVQNQSQRSEESGISGEENDSSAVDMLEEYKPKLFKKYKKAGYDLTSVIPDRHKRYDIVHDKVYLDENVRVGRKSWRIMTYKRKSKFLRDLGTVLWTKKRIATRALDLSKLKKKNFGTQPIVLFSPRKLNLYLSLYRDYLDSSHRYRELPQDVKDILIKNSTESLSYHARDERKNQDEPTEETRNP